LDAEVISRVDVVVVDGGELGPANGVNNVSEEMSAGGVLFNHEFQRALVELRVDPKVAHTDVALRAREQEHITPTGMVLHVGNNLSQLLDIRRLQVNQVEGKHVVFQAPEVHPKIISR